MASGSLPRIRNCTVGKESSEVDDCLECVSLIFLLTAKILRPAHRREIKAVLYRTVNQLR